MRSGAVTVWPPRALLRSRARARVMLEAAPTALHTPTRFNLLRDGCGRYEQWRASPFATRRMLAQSSGCARCTCHVGGRANCFDNAIRLNTSRNGCDRCETWRAYRLFCHARCCAVRGRTHCSSKPRTLARICLLNARCLCYEQWGAASSICAVEGAPTAPRNPVPLTTLRQWRACRLATTRIVAHTSGRVSCWRPRPLLPRTLYA